MLVDDVSRSTRTILTSPIRRLSLGSKGLDLSKLRFLWKNRVRTVFWAQYYGAAQLLFSLHTQSRKLLSVSLPE